MESTKKDWLTPTIRSVWRSEMTSRGFITVGKRNWARHQHNMLVHFDFQLSSYGSKDFCINVWIATSASHSGGLMFRLQHPNRTEAWLAASSKEKADVAAKTSLEMALNQAFPVVERNSNPQDHAAALRKEKWGSAHHQHFAIGVAEALAGRRKIAVNELTVALALYQTDASRVDWALRYAGEVKELLSALETGAEKILLDAWSLEALKKLRIMPA